MDAAAHPTDIHVGQMLRIIRKRAGRSQQTVADHLGLSFQQVQKYERGTNRVSASKLWEIARYFGVSVTAFYQGLDGSEAGSASGLSAEMLAFLATPEGAEVARLLPRVPSDQRAKLIGLIAVMAR